VCWAGLASSTLSFLLFFLLTNSNHSI
jgi:hypothetical protein